MLSAKRLFSLNKNNRLAGYLQVVVRISSNVLVGIDVANLIPSVSQSIRSIPVR